MSAHQTPRQTSTATPKVIALVREHGAEWYAKDVVAPMLAYDFQGEINARESVEQHMAGFPEPLRSECRAAVKALEANDER